MILTQPDRERLVSLLKSSRNQPALGTRAKLTEAVERATIVAPDVVPETVVTMNSIVRLIDTASGEITSFALVYPADANVDRLKISVLAPLGTALLGRSEGEIIEYAVPSGTKRFFIQKVMYQPEERFRAGAADATAYGERCSAS